MKMIFRQKHIAAACLILLMLVAGTALAQNVFQEPELTIYGGTNPNDNISVSSWGGGVGTEVNQYTYGGPRSISIKPNELYQGGRVDFGKPLDLTKYFNEPDTYIQFVTKFNDTRTSMEAWAANAASPGSTDIYAGTKHNKPVRRVQVMLFFDGGKSTEFQGNVGWYKLQEDGWMAISVPFAYLKRNLNLPEYKLNRMVITGDGNETFYVGEIRIVKDDTPVEVDAGEDKETGKNYSILFHATAQTGASAVKYSWDYDIRNGIQEESQGELVSHKYANTINIGSEELGSYVATCTVSDVFGVKKPVTDTVNVKVNE